MAESRCRLLLLCLVATLIVAWADGDASATASPSVMCNVSVSDLVQCLPAISGKYPARPSKSCCAVMKKANLRCLCSYKSRFTAFGIDPARAMALPSKCGRTLPRGCSNKV